MAITLNDQPVLLLVEGKEDLVFFGAFIKHLNLTNIQIREIGGKTQLASRLESVFISEMALNIDAIGIIRDADSNSKAAFQSVCSALKKSGLLVPQKQTIIMPGHPSVGVLIVPAGHPNGMLEDVCFASITETEILQCIDQYFGCLPQKQLDHVIPKAKLQVYLAAKEPELRLGEAAEKGLWNWEHPVFDPMKDFLRQLSAIPQP